jgi:hypothetical protein
MIVELLCLTAHSLLFAEIPKDQPGQHQKVSGMELNSFLNVLALDVKYLYSNTPGRQTLDDLLAEAQGLGLWRFKQVLKVLKPDHARGCSCSICIAKTANMPCCCMHG